jgi:hypothetical protein
VARNFPGGDADTDTVVSSLTANVPVKTVVWVLNRQGRGGGNRAMWLDKSGEERINDLNSKIQLDRGFSTTDGRWTVPVPAAQFVYVVMTYDETDVSNDPAWYYDGVSQTVTQNQTPVGTANTNTTPFQIGNVSSLRCFEGDMELWGIYNRILSASEIAFLSGGAVWRSPLHITRGLVDFIDMRDKVRGYVAGQALLTGTTKVDSPRVARPGRNRFISIPAAATGNIITASQTEAGDSQSAILQVLSQIDASQTEDGDSQSASTQVLTQIIASQTEDGDTQSAATEALIQIIASQGETGDGQVAAIETLVQITASQTEAGDSQSALMEVLSQIIASQTEDGDSQVAAILSVPTSSIVASQTEVGDSQSAVLQVLAQIDASQAEAGDSQSAALEALIQIAASQAEDGDTQAASISSLIVSSIVASQTEAGDSQSASLRVLTQILANQLEVGDTQIATLGVLVQIAVDQLEDGDTQIAVVRTIIFLEPGRIFKAAVPLRTFKAAVPLRTFKAAVPLRTFKAAI